MVFYKKIRPPARETQLGRALDHFKVTKLLDGSGLHLLMTNLGHNRKRHNIAVKC
jgi:hypothetical protein